MVHYRAFTVSYRTAVLNGSRPSPAASRTDRDTVGIHQMGLTVANISVILPVNLVQSALATKLLPFRPASFYKVISQYLLHADSTRPSKTFGEWVCREFSITPKDLGACAKFMLMTTEISRAQVAAVLPKEKEELRSIRYRLTHHLLSTAAMLSDPYAVVTQYQILCAAPKNDRILALELHDSLHRLKVLASTGCGLALYEVAKYLEERGKYQEAKIAYIEAGDAGIANGYAHGGRIYNAIDKDKKQAEAIWRIGAEKLDNPRCCSYLANVLREKHPEYEKFMTKAAASGIPNAAYNLGNFYCHYKNDLEMGKEWFVVAAVADDAAADWAVSNLKSILRGQKRLGEISSLFNAAPDRMAKVEKLEEQLDHVGKVKKQVS